MRKINLLILSLLIIITSITNVFASTNTEVRTRDNLKIHESIVVTNENIDDILNTPKINEEEKVYDFANLFNTQEELKIYNQIMSFINKSNYDLAVVTINDNNKINEEEYAKDFYDYNYFGYDEYFSGLLILIDMDNRGVYITATGLSENIYTDYNLSKIIDNRWDYIVNKEYYNYVNDLVNQIDSYYQSNKFIKEKNIFDYLKLPLLIAFIGTIVMTLILYFKTRLKIKVGSTVNYLVGEKNIDIDKRFITSTITRTLRNTESSSSSGGSHLGSSGRSHSGAGRRF